MTSQAERDLAALELVRRKGVMLAQLAQLAGDDRLADESRPVVEWFRDEVKAAGTDGRLDELAALLPQAGICREPASPLTPVWDDSQNQDENPGEPEPVMPSPRGLRALLPPSPPAASPGGPEEAALAILGLTLPLISQTGSCQVAEAGVRCRGEARFPLAAQGREVWLCPQHNYAVCKTLRTSGERTAG